jgi:hypothetical protein
VKGGFVRIALVKWSARTVLRRIDNFILLPTMKEIFTDRDKIDYLSMRDLLTPYKKVNESYFRTLKAIIIDRNRLSHEVFLLKKETNKNTLQEMIYSTVKKAMGNK